MKINILEPIGWCSGVANAIANINKIITKHKKQKIYLVGWLVHNELLMNGIKNKGVIILDDTKKTRLELLNKIRDPQAIIVLSAHGSSQEVIDYANTHFKQYYDLTCSYLLDNFNLIKRLIKQGHRIIYYGKRNHPETQTVLSFNPYIQLVETNDDAKKIKWEANKKYALVNQSTTPQLLADEIKTILMKTNPNLQYVNTTCKVMSTRFDNIRKLKDVDYLIIIGDSKSNNTNQLINLAKHYQIKHQLITDISDIKPNSFKNVKNLSITSGTSVDPKHVQTIIKKIKTTIK